MWQWWNHCMEQVPPGTVALRLNLDDFSMFVSRRCQGARIRRQDTIPRRLCAESATAKRRCCLTHVGLICDRPDLQPLLPQVVIGNERTFPKASFAALQSACPPNVVLVKQKNAWNDKVLCASILHRLGAALKDHIRRRPPANPSLRCCSFAHCSQSLVGV